MEFQKNVSLKDYTTFKIGGRAKYFCIVSTKPGLVGAIKLAKKMKLPIFILGAGSNLLISDKGYNGLVIKIENCKLKVEFCDSRTKRKKKTKSSSHIKNCKVNAEAGVPLNKLVSVSAEKSLSGMEWAAGIPGTVGGAVYGNAGAFGKSMKDVIKTVTVLKIPNPKSDHSPFPMGWVAQPFNKGCGEIPNKFQTKKYKNKECRFGYRDSIFKKRKDLIIISVTLQLKKGKKKEIGNIMKEYLEYKKKTQPLNFPSAGSVFKNPKGFFAAELVEKCGLKGKKIGNAKFSEKHANFIVNLGGAAAQDVKKLINLAKKSVKNKFKVKLEEEIQYLDD